MGDSGARLLLVDRTFRATDWQGRIELALVLWLELALGYGDRLCRWFAARPLTTCMVWSLWLSCLYFALGPASYVKVPDCGNGTLPARMVIANDFLHGRLSPWMNFSGCGTDRVLNNYRLEPHCILLALLPGWLGYGLIMLGQRFIASYFFFRVTHDDLKFTPSAAILTGLAYSLFHQIGIHWQWDGFTLYDGLGIPGLPLLLWLTNRLVDRPWWQTLSGAVGLGCGLGLCAPYFQTLFFPFLALFWYTFIQRAWSWKRFALLSCLFVGWVSICGPEMLAAARYVPLSHRVDIVVRSDSPYVRYIENVQHWPKAVWKSNSIYMIVAAVGLACARLRDLRVVITALAVFGILSFVSHYHYFNDNYLSHLGILSSFHFHRFIYLVPFLCALTLGLGINVIPADTMLTLNNRLTSLRLNIFELMPIAVSILLIVTSTHVNLQRWKQLWRGENFASLYHHPDLLALAEQTKGDPEFRVACATDMWRPGLGMSDSHRWSISPGVAWAYGFETTDGYQVLYSQRYKQFWSEVLLPLLRRDSLRATQHVYWGNMVFLWSPAKTDMNQPFAAYFNLELLSLANTKYLISAIPLEDPDLILLPSEHRDRLLKWEARSGTQRFFSAWRGEWSFRPLYIYENRRVLPRFYIANQVALYDSANSLVHEMRSHSVGWLHETVAVNQADLPPEIDLTALADDSIPACQCDVRQVTVVSRTADRIELDCESSQASVLFLANSYHPDWQATINGEPAPVFPANHAFQGVYLPSAGKHRVVVAYRPAGLLTAKR